jgi:hypothetical protein
MARHGRDNVCEPSYNALEIREEVGMIMLNIGEQEDIGMEVLEFGFIV